MNILEIIGTCSGGCGLEMYHNSSKEEFISWFKNNIAYNSEETKKLGEELIVYLENN